VLASSDFIKLEISKIENGKETDGNEAEITDKIRNYISELSINLGGKKKLVDAFADSEANRPLTNISTNDCNNIDNVIKYSAKVFFEDGCQMENIRAFTIIHGLKDLCNDIYFIPENIEEDSKSADYIAENCLKKIEGDGLYGKGDITPVVCILQNLSIIPKPQRRDIPVISIGNNAIVNEALKASLNHLLIEEKVNYIDHFKSFIKKYRRMVGYLDVEPALDEMGMVVEPGYCVVPTASDNRGDDRETTEHKIGYVAYFNKGIMDKTEGVPLVMCFHGGGDSAMCMVALSDWHLVVAKYSFLLVSVENHLNSTATETMALIAHLKEKYHIDSERIYSTGFSMGGCKTWDLFQEYPKVFAAVAPMDATFDVGLNVYGQPVENINQETTLPVFYVGGENTPLPELPFQEAKCMNRMAYVLKVNKATAKYNVKYEEKENWVNRIWGIDGDVICKAKDDVRGSILTMHLFKSENGCCYSIFASASNQSHEMRHLNCENAWKFFSQFRRLQDGTIVGGKMEDIIKLYED
jgi:hypothetical protein